MFALARALRQTGRRFGSRKLRARRGDFLLSGARQQQFEVFLCYCKLRLGVVAGDAVAFGVEFGQNVALPDGAPLLHGLLGNASAFFKGKAHRAQIDAAVDSQFPAFWRHIVVDEAPGDGCRRQCNHQSGRFFKCHDSPSFQGREGRPYTEDMYSR